MRLYLGRDILLGDASTGHFHSICRHYTRHEHGATLSMDAHVSWLVQISLVLLLAGVACPSRPSPHHRQQHHDTTTEAMLTGVRSVHSSTRTLEAIVIRETTDDEDLVVDAGSGMELTGSNDRHDLQHRIQDVAVKVDCCDVGRIAAVNGLRCDTHIHRTMMERVNRTRDYHHRVRLPVVYHQHLSMPLRSFNMCIYNKEKEFYKCCHAAKTKQKEMRLWHRVPQARARPMSRYHVDGRLYSRG